MNTCKEEEEGSDMPFWKKREEYEEEEELEEEYMEVPLTVRVKFRPNSNTYWKVAHDVEPPEDLVRDVLFASDEVDAKRAQEELIEWFSEEWGGGEWKIELVQGRKIVTSKVFKIKDVPVKYGVNKWAVFVKGPNSGRWYKADVDFDHPPDTAEVIDAIGGGGNIRVVAYDEKGRQVSSWTFKSDAPTPDWIASKENSIEKTIIEAIKKKQEEEVAKMVSSIAGTPKVEKKEPDKFDEFFEEMEKLVNDQRLQLIEEFLRKLKRQEEKSGITDLLFTEPYKVKMKALDKLVDKLIERGRVDEAKELLREMPDGTSALISLITAGSNLANALSMALVGAGTGFADFEKRRSEVAKKLTTGKKEVAKKEEKPEKVSVVEEMEEEEKVQEVVVSREETEVEKRETGEELLMEISEEDSSWEISFVNEEEEVEEEGGGYGFDEVGEIEGSNT